MAKNSRPIDPDSRRKILASYDRAKQKNPDLSPADYAWSVPEMRERFKNKKTAGAYIRVLKQGRRSGGEIYAAASKQKGLYQVEFLDEKGHRIYSQNLKVANAETEFDIAQIEQELGTPKGQEHLKEQINKYKEKYGLKGTDQLSPNRVRVRQITQQHRPTYRMAI